MYKCFVKLSRVIYRSRPICSYVLPIYHSVGENQRWLDSFLRRRITTVHLLNFLHSAMTLLKMLTEKLSRVSSVCRSGSVTRTFLCIGVNQSVESPATPYFSSLQRVRTSHVFVSGHQNAWSDQSFDSASIQRGPTKSSRL